MKDIQKMFINNKINPRSIDPKKIIAYKGAYNRFFKPITDFTLAIVCLIILLPAYFFVAVAIVAETGFPILYKAKRGGYRGRTFLIYKFRTMVKDAEMMGGGTTALNDFRVTRVGSFLRKTKLDEITQLFNIIKFEMSFIGPRPELLRYTKKYKGAEKLILMVRPGITDFSSIEYINLDEVVGEKNADEYYEKHVLKKKNLLRIKYAASVSFSTDFKLFILTCWKVMEKTINVFANRYTVKEQEAERELAV